MGAEARPPDSAFWVEPEAVRGERLRLNPEESHHILHVHRAAPGAAFDAVDGAGTLYRCVLEPPEGQTAVGRIVERVQGVGELPAPIHLLVGLPTPGSVEAVVEHAVPLGAVSIDFVVCERSGRPQLTAERLGRLTRIARAGLKQCRRSRLTTLRSSGSISAALTLLEGAARFLADPAGKPWITGAPPDIQPGIALSVGPPGGYTDRERSELLGSGFSAISLGPSRLTTETASIALLTYARNWLQMQALGPS